MEFKHDNHMTTKHEFAGQIEAAKCFLTEAERNLQAAAERLSLTDIDQVSETIEGLKTLVKHDEFKGRDVLMDSLGFFVSKSGVDWSIDLLASEYSTIAGSLQDVASILKPTPPLPLEFFTCPPKTLIFNESFESTLDAKTLPKLRDENCLSGDSLETTFAKSVKSHLKFEAYLKTVTHDEELIESLESVLENTRRIEGKLLKNMFNFKWKEGTDRTRSSGHGTLAIQDITLVTLIDTFNIAIKSNRDDVLSKRQRHRLKALMRLKRWAMHQATADPPKLNFIFNGDKLGKGIEFATFKSKKCKEILDDQASGDFAGKFLPCLRKV
jgi:hypothetical protein